MTPTAQSALRGFDESPDDLLDSLIKRDTGKGILVGRAVLGDSLAHRGIRS